MPAKTKLWPALLAARSLAYTAQSSAHPDWNGQGSGSVAVDTPAPDTITFHESGQWHSASGYQTHFTNAYRWTLLSPAALKLEHLRFGQEHPVLLFEMTPTGKAQWQSTTPHHCKQDCYHATLDLRKPGFLLTWHIIGPSRADTIRYAYTCSNT